MLEAKSLAFSYGRKVVWGGVDLSLAGGKIVFLRGVNGSGKSTLLRCLAGRLRPREEEVRFLGKPIFAPARRDLAGLSLVPDVPAFYDDLTGSEHLQHVSCFNGHKEVEERGLALAGEFHMADALDVLPSALSWGMRYKLALVLVLATHPQVLLLDEPFAPIDANADLVLGRELGSLAADGSAVLLSVHGDVAALKATYTLRLDGGFLYGESC